MNRIEEVVRMVWVVSALLPALAWSLSEPEKPEAFVYVLDTRKVKAAYDSGKFQTAVDILEESTRGHREYSLLDSIFIARNLAILYSLDPRTRERGRYYMFRLLTWLPSDRLEDVQVPEEIRSELEKMRIQFIASGDSTCDVSEPNWSLGGWAVAGTGNPSEGTQMSREENDNLKPSSRSHKTARKSYWYIGGAGALGTGILIGSLVYIRASQSPEVRRKTLTVGEGNGG